MFVNEMWSVIPVQVFPLILKNLYIILRKH